MTEPDPFDVRIGARIVALRQERRVTQAELARKIGVTFQQVQKYEKGRNRVSGSRLVQVAEALSTTVADVVGQTDPNQYAGADRLLESWSKIQSAQHRKALLQ